MLIACISVNSSTELLVICFQYDDAVTLSQGLIWIPGCVGNSMSYIYIERERAIESERTREGVRENAREPYVYVLTLSVPELLRGYIQNTM